MLNVFIDVAELVSTWQLYRSLETVGLLGYPLLALYYQLNVTFEFLTALFWWIQVFRHIIMCHWTSGFQHFEGM